MKKLTILLVLSLLLLFACAKQGKEEVKLSGAFIGGTDGISAKFIANAPPDAVYDANDQFDIIVELENKGEWSTEAGDVKVTIEGISPQTFGKDLNYFQQIVATPLEARRKDPTGRILEGSRETVNFEQLEYQGSVVGEAQFTIRADVCYKYGTKVNTKVCILKDLLRYNPAEVVCDPNEAKPFENSAAPLQVTNVVESVAGKDKVALSFTIQNQGTGKVYRKGTYCSQELADKDRVYVKLSAGIPDIANIRCSGIEGSGSEGYARLDETGKAEIRCSIELPASRIDFESLVSIQLEYDYQQYIEKPLTVKHYE